MLVHYIYLPMLSLFHLLLYMFHYLLYRNLLYYMFHYFMISSRTYRYDRSFTSVPGSGSLFKVLVEHTSSYPTPAVVSTTTLSLFISEIIPLTNDIIVYHQEKGAAQAAAPLMLKYFLQELEICIFLFFAVANHNL